MKRLKQPQIGKKVLLGKNVQIARDVVIGDNSVIEANAILYDGVRLGKNSFVGGQCVLGERLRAYYTSPKTYKAPFCEIGDQALLRSGTVISGDVKIGSFFETGPYVTVREKTVIGHHTRFGNFSDIQSYCKVGNYVSGHSHVSLGPYSTIEDYVWMHPFCLLIDDKYPPTILNQKGPHIGKYSVLGVYAVIFPGVRLGEHVVVGAQSVVKKDFGDYQLIAGNPAKAIMDPRKLKTTVKGKLVRPYPWMQHRAKGYPWESRLAND